MAWAERFNDFMDLPIHEVSKPNRNQSFTNIDVNSGTFSGYGQNEKRSSRDRESEFRRNRSTSTVKVKSEYKTPKTGPRSEQIDLCFEGESDFLPGNFGQIIDISGSMPTVVLAVKGIS